MLRDKINSISKRRLSGRAVDPTSGRIYNDLVWGSLLSHSGVLKRAAVMRKALFLTDLFYYTSMSHYKTPFRVSTFS